MVYSKYAGTELELQGDAFVLLKVRRQPGSFWSGVLLAAVGWPRQAGSPLPIAGAPRAATACVPDVNRASSSFLAALRRRTT